MFGAQRTLLTLLEHIDRVAYSCVVCAPHPGPFVDSVLALGIPCELTPRVRWVPAAGEVTHDGRRHWIGQFARGLRARAAVITTLIRRHRIDLVYTNTVVSVEGALAARRCGVPHLWHIHEPLHGNPELGALFPPWLYTGAIGWLSDSLVFCSDSLASTYPTLRGRARIVFNGLPPPLPIDRQTARERLLRECGIGGDSVVVAVVGAIQPRKDHATFIRAAHLLIRKRSNIQFLIVGADVSGGIADLRKQIEAAGLNNAMRLVGWWPGSIHELMAGIDVLAISSTQESFGLTVLEAFSVETPVVSTRCGGPEEIIRDGVDGYLVSVGDEVALAARIEDLVVSASTRAAFGIEGKARFMARFTVQAYTDALQRAMTQTVACHRSHHPGSSN